MTMIKTPRQIADEQMGAFTISPDSDYDLGAFGEGDAEECSAEYIRDQIIAAIEADRAQREAVPIYRAGDPDPTPDTGGSCPAERGGFLCTWSPGHEGVHVAGDGDTIAAVWS